MDTKGKTKLVAILDDDDSMRTALQGLLKAVGLPAQAFASAEVVLSCLKARSRTAEAKASFVLAL